WAAWPFETLLLPALPAERLDRLDAATRDDLAAVLGRLLRRYDGLFGRALPYSMGWHAAPTGPEAFEASAPHWRGHRHPPHPPLPPPLPGADARKFMVGYELLAEPQRDLTPEDAAALLQAADPATV